MDQINAKPIGFVKTKLSKSMLKKRQYNSDLVIRSEYEHGLKGIEGFSHLNVVFWMNRVHEKERKDLKSRPRGRSDMPLIGVFATRSPHRPNPIGLTLVELVRRKRNILTVKGLDAMNGTPILDLKPYDKWDSAKSIRVPNWWKQLADKKND
ncbi:MAG: tRNA (N6-threonylcarbamoyladenosine(37)-N6)-methyltransferase TrmO [Candidatus Bathyarchaeota archaeon]|nr:tRNA (N6-threonylcarbamoyladenosine(37)-N6)-methyltransferase TrmO [Candidatus Bathyarchaeota archaeon]